MLLLSVCIYYLLRKCILFSYFGLKVDKSFFFFLDFVFLTGFDAAVAVSFSTTAAGSASFAAATATTGSGVFSCAATGAGVAAADLEEDIDVVVDKDVLFDFAIGTVFFFNDLDAQVAPPPTGVFLGAMYAGVWNCCCCSIIVAADARSGNKLSSFVSNFCDIDDADAPIRTLDNPIPPPAPPPRM